MHLINPYTLNIALKTGLLAAGAVIAYNALAKGKAAMSLNFFPGKFSNINFKNGSPTANFSILAQNSSNQFLKINSIVGNLYSNGYLIGNVSSYNINELKPNSESFINLNVRLFLIGVVQELIDAIKGNGFTHVINFEGQINLNKFQVPLNLKYTVG